MSRSPCRCSHRQHHSYDTSPIKKYDRYTTAGYPILSVSFLSRLFVECVPTQNEKVTIPYPCRKLANCRLRFLWGVYSCTGCPPSQLLNRTARRFTPLGNATINSRKARLPLRNRVPQTHAHKRRRGPWNAKKGAPQSRKSGALSMTSPQPIMFRGVYSTPQCDKEALPTAT